MAVPKRKTSKSRVRTRRRAHPRSYASAKACPQCSSPHLPHRVCASCGYYNGRQVLTIDVD